MDRTNRYLTSLDRETKAFKNLIEEKARMTVPISNAVSSGVCADAPSRLPPRVS